MTFGKIDKFLEGEELEKALNRAIKVWKENLDMQTLKIMHERFYQIPKKILKDRLIKEGLFPPNKDYTDYNMTLRAKTFGPLLDPNTRGRF